MKGKDGGYVILLQFAGFALGPLVPLKKICRIKNNPYPDGSDHFQEVSVPFHTAQELT